MSARQPMYGYVINGNAMMREVESEARAAWRAMLDARRRGRSEGVLAEWERGRAVEIRSFLSFLLWLRRVGLGQGRSS